MDAEGMLSFGHLKAGYGNVVPQGIVDKQSPWKSRQGNVIPFSISVFEVNKVPEAFFWNQGVSSSAQQVFPSGNGALHVFCYLKDVARRVSDT